MTDKPNDVSNALQVFSKDQALCKYVLSARSMVIPDGVKFEVVEQLLGGMKLVTDSVQFWIGDLLVYSERSFGEMFSQLVDGMDYEPQSLKDMMWVSHSVAPNVRRKELSWSHHREVAKLVQDDQKTMLEAAVADNLSVSELRALIRKDNKKEKGSKVEVYKEALEEVLVLAKNSPPNCLARILIVVGNALGKSCNQETGH